MANGFSLPVLLTFSDAVQRLGELGASQAGKMANNLILWACLLENVEGLAETLGADGSRQKWNGASVSLKFSD